MAQVGSERQLPPACVIGPDELVLLGAAGNVDSSAKRLKMVRPEFTLKSSHRHSCSSRCRTLSTRTGKLGSRKIQVRVAQNTR
ncbi:hypothetical protein D9M73_92170 [compost metagenome]